MAAKAQLTRTAFVFCATLIIIQSPMSLCKEESTDNDLGLGKDCATNLKKGLCSLLDFH